MEVKETNSRRNNNYTNAYSPLQADAKSHQQNCDYGKENKPAPDNNIFFEERSNPLSSKGN